MARTSLPLSIGTVGKGGEVQRRRSRAGSGLTVMHRTPSRLVDGSRVSTTIATTSHATTTTEDAGGATTTTTIVTAGGCRTRASEMRGSPRVSKL
jgi:hypothetical protein